MDTNNEIFPNDMTMKTEPRRGTRNRVAKTRPGFVDPFSLRKKRKARSVGDVSSPVSSCEIELTSKETTKETIDNKTNESKSTSTNFGVFILPFKKRPEYRVTWLHLKTSSYKTQSQPKMKKTKTNKKVTKA